MDRLSVIKELSIAIEKFDDYYQKISVKLDLEADLLQQIELLNQEVNWIETVGSTESFENSIIKLEEDYSQNVGIDKMKILKVALDRLKTKSKDVVDKVGLWEYCNKENIDLIIDLQNEKLKYLTDSFREIGVFCQGVEDIHDLVTKDYELVKLGSSNSSSNHFTEEEKRSNKLKLAILFKLGVIDHLKKIDSLKNNDTAMSRVLGSFIGVKGDSFQSYLSAAKNNPKSSSSQNNPLSAKLMEKAETIIERAGVNLNDL